jgi:hypothetical protein
LKPETRYVLQQLIQLKLQEIMSYTPALTDLNFKNGMAARKENKPPTDNPHENWTEAHRHWEQGYEWQSALEDSESAHPFPPADK